MLFLLGGYAAFLMFLWVAAELRPSLWPVAEAACRPVVFLVKAAALTAAL